MFLNEVLDSDVPFTIRLALTRNFSTEAVINGRKIHFSAIAYEDDGVLTWKVLFTESQDGKPTLNATGSGGEFQVFNMIVKSMLELVKRYDPDRIVFTSSNANDNGQTRADLYARLFDRFKIPGYTMIRRKLGGVYDFELVHDRTRE